MIAHTAAGRHAGGRIGHHVTVQHDDPADRTPAAGASTAVARRRAPTHVGDGVERPITVDQTNRSVVVDEAVIVKWFRPPRPVPHHGSDVLAHLTEVGFDQMPGFFGADEQDGLVVASVAEYLPGATDGWEWYLDEVHAWIDGTLTTDVLERRATGLGHLAGRLHVALATPSSRWPAPVGEVAVQTQLDRMQALYERAHAVTTGVTAERLAGRWTAIRAAIEPQGVDGAAATPAIAVHGDLHVGNVLAVGDRLVVTDFDGNPLSDDAAARQPAVVDVASLLQSIDHIGRIVDHRTGGARRADLTAFIDDSVARALDAYRTELAAAALPHLLDDRLLPALRVAQELHELAYAAAHLPHWVYVPDGALTAMFPDES
jgi:maltokinase